jgi:hypothetical protein
MPGLKLKSKSKANIFNQADIEVFTFIDYERTKYKLKKPLVCKVKRDDN